MSFKDKMLCKMLQKMIAKKDPATFEPWMKALIEAIGQTCDGINIEYLTPLITYINESSYLIAGLIYSTCSIVTLVSLEYCCEEIIENNTNKILITITVTIMPTIIFKIILLRRRLSTNNELICISCSTI